MKGDHESVVCGVEFVHQRKAHNTFSASSWFGGADNPAADFARMPRKRATGGSVPCQTLMSSKDDD